MSTAVASLALALALGQIAAAQPRIHEPDRLSGPAGAALRLRMADVVLLAPRDTVVVQDGSATLLLETRTGLCRDQRFSAQRGVNSACSGILVDTGLVLTASHCLQKREIDEWVVVFGHDGDKQTPIRTANIRGIRHCVPDNEHGDIVAIELDAPIEPTQRLPLAAPENQERVHLLGHPFGLALKASTCSVDARCQNPRVTQVGRDWYLADLDAFGGNSGSPVYAEDGKSLVGIWSGSPNVPTPRPGSRSSCLVYPAYRDGQWGGKATRVDRFMRDAADPARAVRSCAGAE